MIYNYQAFYDRPSYQQRVQAHGPLVSDKMLYTALFCLLQPYTIGALLNRDDTLSSIVNHGLKVNLQWATSKPSLTAPSGEQSQTDGEGDGVPCLRMSSLQDKEDREDMEKNAAQLVQI